MSTSRMRVPLALTALAILLASCTTARVPQQSNGQVSGPANYVRPLKDGAPWWDVDVSQIPDAVPMPYAGTPKSAPYTVFGQPYFPISSARNYRSVGLASWYGTRFHGQATANGETYDLYGMTAAHKTLPLPSYVKVTNLDNGRSVTLRVNDRGPFFSDRIIDLSYAAAKKLGYADRGTARVMVEGIEPQQWWAARGQRMPAAGTRPPLVVPQVTRTTQSETAMAGPLLEQSAVATARESEVYVPPADRYAGIIDPQQVEVKKNAPVPAAGLYLQLGAFANPDAAELLRARLSQAAPNAPAFVSPIVRNRQVLHRVRLGPLDTPDEARSLQLRLASLGKPTLVGPD